MSTSYAGQRLGLPAGGRGAAAGWPRRILALFVDWFASWGVAGLIVQLASLHANGWENWLTLLVFWLQLSLLTPLVGGSFGQLACRIAVVRPDRRRVNLAQSALRSLLICLVVPPVIYNRDQRGLHDLAVGTVTVRR